MAAQPLFLSAHEALVWATNLKHGNPPRSSMNSMMAPSTGSGGRGLGGLDGAAQAGMILGELRNLTNEQARAIFCRVAPKYSICTCGTVCCSGSRPDNNWSEAFGYLMTYLRDELHASNKTGRRGLADLALVRKGILLKYFGEKIILKDLAEAEEVTEVTVGSHKAIYIGILRRVEKAGWEAFDLRLRKVGIVGEDA